MVVDQIKRVNGKHGGQQGNQRQKQQQRRRGQSRTDGCERSAKSKGQPKPRGNRRERAVFNLFKPLDVEAATSSACQYAFHGFANMSLVFGAVLTPNVRVVPRYRRRDEGAPQRKRRSPTRC